MTNFKSSWTNGLGGESVMGIEFSQVFGNLESSRFCQCKKNLNFCNALARDRVLSSLMYGTELNMLPMVYLII